MTYYETTTRSIGKIGLLDRAIRSGAGLGIIMATLHVSIEYTTSYSFTMLFATLIVLTGIAGWDPLYASARSMVARMRQIEFVTLSTGNISMPDRFVRIALGLGVLVYSLEASFAGAEAYPFVKLFASLIVLTGIAGWDPIYAAFRSLVMRLSSRKPRYRWLQARYI